METTPSPAGRLRAGRPTQAEAEQLGVRLREAALEVFLEKGFDGTSMEAVAKAAGITKRTLYGRYPDKRTLFGAVVKWALSRWAGDEPPAVEPGGDLAAGLLAIGRSALARAVDPDVARLTRMATAEAHRFPEFALSTRTLTWSPRIRAVVDLLEAHAGQGKVTAPDREIAAEQFLAMVTMVPAQLAAFGLARDSELEERHLRHAVHLFLNGVLSR
ncbi:TetR/AcrR family transcriptional regulator [Streptomyces sp. UG1]|uniref:TetR/AcrR family transcriptional regulator n=1 Tax=Streptomyces sp. UG1 TaxID=3417652 RepID=UPI003CF1E21A